jgi:hypothetical protein
MSVASFCTVLGGDGWSCEDEGRPEHPLVPGPIACEERSNRMRILFFADSPGVAQRHSTALAELVGRGHELRLALSPKKTNLGRKTLQGLGVREYAPRRSRCDGWRSIAWSVRAIADLARYAHPRYEQARVLRDRMKKKVVGRLEGSDEFDPVTRRLALEVARRLSTTMDAELAERTIALTARLEAAIPPSRRISRYIREQRPDVVLVSPVVRAGSDQVEFLKSARKLGIPAATLIPTWDSLTNKGLLKLVPERVFVWNELQRREAIELHGAPPERVVATGAHAFDYLFDRQPTSRDTFMDDVGLEPSSAYVLFLGSSPFVSRRPQKEVKFLRRWINELRASTDEALQQIGVVIRPHPMARWGSDEFDDCPNVVVWPANPARAISAEQQAIFFDTVFHAAAVVGINTTAMIEAAIIGKSVLTILEPSFAQEATLHFHHLLEENGGFLHVASSLAEHANQLGEVLRQNALDAERRERFVQQFVRPPERTRPASLILADEIENLAGLRVDSVQRAPLLGVLLYLALPLSSAALFLQPLRGALRRRLGDGKRRPLPRRTLDTQQARQLAWSLPGRATPGEVPDPRPRQQIQPRLRRRLP